VNFFDAQDKAKRATRWLVVVYLFSTALIVAGITAIVGAVLISSDQGDMVNPSVLAATAVLSTLFILGATLYKTSILSGGGGRVALDMGGTLVPTDVRDPLRRRLRNVVEEMAIASGVPVPEIYVLEGESGINAFAAGFSPGDAAVAVTRGTLELLDRDELQGVIAHEFSHILNGDMRLNIRMMGVLFGIMVLGIIGRMVLRGSYYGALGSSRRNRNGSAILIIGIGLTVLGWIGVLFARMIKAAVSRQREFLADASAVQFTRSSEGIANALKKIGGYSEHSYIRQADAEEISHMLFAGGTSSMTSLLSTHPPLSDRIKALDPSFDEGDYPVVVADQVGDAAAPEHVAGFTGSTSHTSDSGGQGQAILPDQISASIGQPSPEHIVFARQLRRSIPALLYDAAHSSPGAYLLALALVIDEPHADRQIEIVEGQLGKVRAAEVRTYFSELQKVGVKYRLPLLEISFPTLKNRPAQKLEFLLNLVRRLIEADGEINLREYCYFRILSDQLEQAAAPSAGRSGNRVAKSAARNAAVDLLRIVADQGHDDDAAADDAFAAGVELFGKWAKGDDEAIEPGKTVERLDEVLDILSKINSAGRQSLIKAVTVTVSHDGKLSATEGELLRAISTSLGCPLPPILQSAD